MRKKAKGFTLIELIVVIAIIGILAAILVPSLSGYIQKAKKAAAINDAKTIKNAVESSLSSHFLENSNSAEFDAAFNKMLYNDTKQERVGAFTNKSWNIYKNKIKNNGASQIVDTVIAGGLDEMFSEYWKAGNGTNPLGYGSKGTCDDFLKADNNTFGLVVVYDGDCTVRMMQLYRKGILVTYIDGEYIANTNKKAKFVGTSKWNTIYTDAGLASNDDFKKVYLSNKQIKTNGDPGPWY